VLVATIGGNGDEASGYVNDGGRRLFSPRLTPAIACIDPSMMDTHNHQDMVDGALVALAHAVEAFLDLPAGPMCHAYAHSAIGLIANRLPLALRQTDAKLNCCAVVNGQVAAGCAFSTASAGICHALAVELKESTDLPLGYLLALLLPHLVAQVGDQQSERAGDLLYPLVGADTYALTASDYKIPRIMALFWDFFDALGGELDRRIPLSFSQAGLADEQISRAQSTVSGTHAADAVARIVRGARLGADLL
jgi:alcohol dehydrogenase class IV